ncbi:MAG: DEAD/DEAH box helicase, partial [Rhodospirillales bacterium]|nr:DEAD/DEAH box helicase [Rhodospirillales bacterium]
MDRLYGRPATLAESTVPGVSDDPPPAQTGNEKNGPRIGGMAPGAAARVLREVFGFEGFRPGQEGVIETLLAGRHALTVMPTGSGKSLCFQIPALVMDGLTVVVSPLIALMQDQ